jgi:two-component system response regulator LytT
MAKILIVEDEVLIAGQLKKYLEVAGHSCCGHATSYEEADILLRSEKPDLVLLDIQLYGERNGIDLAQLINKEFRIPFIYLTSHFERSTLEDAKSTYPAGYLTKPYQPETLITTLEIGLFNHSSSIDDQKEVRIMEGKKTHLFKTEEILFMESDHVYTRVVLNDREILIRKSLNDISATFAGNNFLRVHRSFLVNIRHIKQINSAYIVINSKRIPIGKTFRLDVLKIINSHPKN